MPRDIDPRAELTATVDAIETALAAPGKLKPPVRLYLAGYSDGIRYALGHLEDGDASVYEFRYVVGFADGTVYAASLLPNEGA